MSTEQTTKTPRVVIITGISGAGRRTAAHAVEDLGWYVVDNLPPAMLGALVDEIAANNIDRLAVVLDVRSRIMFDALGVAVNALDERGIDLPSSSWKRPMRQLCAARSPAVVRCRCNKVVICSTPLPLSGGCCPTCEPRLISSSTPRRSLPAS
ncbi:P-loop-containing kinase [Cutibacterium acnes JCM 18916]|nr:P-loop-containing kinase [Cutibacterium acnes JCM 18916]